MSLVNGVVVGLVTQVNVDGRVKVHFPWLDPHHASDWIRVATMMAGGGRGSFFMPELNDEVLVAFEHGDARFPFVIGFLWNGQDHPPAEHVRDRTIRSKNGHSIRFLDSTPRNGDLGGIIIEDAHHNRITLTNGQVTIKSTSVVTIEGAHIVLKVGGVTRVVSPNTNPI
jgi:uncharacterized protein involved in type VI secretion and phage assembly